MGDFMGFRSERGCSILGIVGWAVALILGLLLLWFGVLRPLNQDRQETDVPASPTVAQTGEALPTAAVPTATPTSTPQPSPTPSPTTEFPTAAPPTATTVAAEAVAGADGANLRSGPDVSFSLLGHVEPGTSMRITGRSGDWWQVDYQGSAAWVYNQVVTAANTENVPQVQAPATPVPPTAAPTPIPTDTPVVTVLPTDTPGPRSVRGLVPSAFSVEGAPGPFTASSTSSGCGSDSGAIWYNMEVTSTAGQDVEYKILGAWVQETQYHKPSWTNQRFKPGERLVWRDCLRIPSAGTYHLFLVICFTDGVCEQMLGPVVIEVK